MIEILCPLQKLLASSKLSTRVAIHLKSSDLPISSCLSREWQGAELIIPRDSEWALDPFRKRPAHRGDIERLLELSEKNIGEVAGPTPTEPSQSLDYAPGDAERLSSNRNRKLLHWRELGVFISILLSSNSGYNAILFHSCMDYFTSQTRRWDSWDLIIHLHSRALRRSYLYPHPFSTPFATPTLARVQSTSPEGCMSLAKQFRT